MLQDKDKTREFESLDALSKELGVAYNTLCRYRNAKYDLFGDPLFTGEFTEEGQNTSYETTQGAINGLKYYLMTMRSLSQANRFDGSRKASIAERTAYLRDRILSHHFFDQDRPAAGTEDLLVTDLLHVTLRIRGIGDCHLYLRNREWLYVEDEAGVSHRAHIDDVVVSKKEQKESHREHINDVVVSEKTSDGYPFSWDDHYWPFPLPQLLEIVADIQSTKGQRGEICKWERRIYGWES